MEAEAGVEVGLGVDVRAGAGAGGVVEGEHGPADGWKYDFGLRLCAKLRLDYLCIPTAVRLPMYPNCR